MAEKTVTIPPNRRSGGTPHDDAMLEHERVTALARVIAEDIERDETPSVSLTAMLLLELEYLRAALLALGPDGSAS